MHTYVSYCTQIKANLTPTLLNTYLPLAFNYSLHCQYFHKKCNFSFLTSVQMFAEPNHAFFNKCISWGQVIPLYDILMTYWTEVPVWELISYKHFLFLYILKYRPDIFIYIDSYFCTWVGVYLIHLILNLLLCLFQRHLLSPRKKIEKRQNENVLS